MSKQTEALKLALEALHKGKVACEWGQAHDHVQQIVQAMDAIREALAEQPAQQEPVAKVPGMAVQALAGEIIEALLADEKDGGYDLTAGLFGSKFSALVRRWAAAEWNTFPQPAQQEPVAWLDGPHLVMRSDWRDRANYKGPWVDIGRAIPDSWVPALYTSPPARPWVGLTDEDILRTLRPTVWAHVEGHHREQMLADARAIEAKLMEKNS